MEEGVMATVPGHPLISKDPEICGGRAVIAGTRTQTATVWRVLMEANGREARRGRLPVTRETFAHVFNRLWDHGDPYPAEHINAALDYEVATGEVARADNAEALRQQIIARLEEADTDEVEAIWAAVQAVPAPERLR
jgi:uncharacterized protein (DUF433 family)